MLYEIMLVEIYRFFEFPGLPGYESFILFGYKVNYEEKLVLRKVFITYISGGDIYNVDIPV
jgi:hypothetical protein